MNPNPTATEQAQQAEFLDALFGQLEDGVIELRAISPTHVVERCFVPVGDRGRGARFIHAYRGSHHLYAGVASRADASSGTLENCRWLTALFADIDFKTLPEPAARERLAAFPLPPSMVVASGGGLHTYFCLREPIECTTEPDLAKAALRRLAVKLGADLSAAEPARVLRLPSTLNHKPEYGTPRLVNLETHDPSRRYNLHEILEHCPAAEAQEAQPAFRVPDTAAPGMRHILLFQLARSLKQKGMAPNEVLAAVRAVNANRCDPQLPDAQVQEQVQSAFKQRDRLGFEPRPLGGDGVRPRIDVGTQDLDGWTEEAIEVLEKSNTPPVLFRWEDGLGRLNEDATGGPAIERVTEDRLRERLAAVAEFVRTVPATKKRSAATVEALPPLALVKNLLARTALPFARLSGIVRTPILDARGDLAQEPGYHAETQTIYWPPADFALPPVPAAPAAAEVAEATTLLDELLADFPFAEGASRTHALGALLLPFVRELIDGPTPLHFITKHTPGTGGTLLASVLLGVSLGRFPDPLTVGDNDDELRKRLTAVLRSGRRVALLDNVNSDLKAEALASLLTSETWSDRVLGASDLITMPNRLTWVATANNPSMSLEMVRRVVPIRLRSDLERPWLRDPTGFRHPDLRGWAAAHHSALVWAALVLARAWVVAGRPAYRGPARMGLFNKYTDVVGGILEHAGLRGFLGNLEAFYDSADTKTPVLKTFVGRWWALHHQAEVGTGDLLPLAEAAELAIESKSDNGRRIRLGALLRKITGRVFNLGDLEVRVDNAGLLQGANRFRLQPTPGGVRESYGSCETSPGTPCERSDSVDTSSIEPTGETPPTPPTPTEPPVEPGF